MSRRSDIPAFVSDVHDHANDCEWISENIENLFDTLKEIIQIDHQVIEAIETLNLIFHCIITRDDYRRWEPILNEALIHAQKLKDNEFLMQIWAELGQNYLQFGLRKEAYEAFTMTSERGEDFNVPEMALIGKIGQLRTQAIYQKGHYRDLVPEVLALAKQLDKPTLHALTHSALTLGHTLRGETKEAFIHGQIAYIWWHKLNNYAQKAEIALLIAEAWRLGSRIDQADRFLKLAEKQIQSPEYTHKLAIYAYQKGLHELEGECGDLGKAEKWFLLALERLGSLNFPFLIGAAHHSLGITQTKLGKYSEARSHLKAAFTIWRSLENWSEQTSVYYAIGFLAFKQGKIESALRWYYRSLEMMEKIPDSPLRQRLEKSLQEDINLALSRLDQSA